MTANVLVESIVVTFCSDKRIPQDVDGYREDLYHEYRDLAPSEVWITHGNEDGLMRWCELHQIAARPLRLVGYEDEPE